MAFLLREYFLILLCSGCFGREAVSGVGVFFCRAIILETRSCKGVGFCSTFAGAGVGAVTVLVGAPFLLSLFMQ